MTVTVFAYGSNMLTGQMTRRASSARSIAPAFLERFALRWHKRSKDGSGKCSIEETGRREDFVWGVLYELNSADKIELDRFEGLGSGYGERRVAVSSQEKNLSVLAYYATSVDPNVRPYRWYRELVVAGAREHGLPEEYIRSLEAISAIEDPDEKRAALARESLRNDAGLRR
ncbi:MAG: gamma-glutamylcyclotransferase family protein [Gammaproteobacteria bacterium]